MQGETEIKTVENQQEKAPKLSEKQMAFLLLRKEGIPASKAAEAVGYHPKHGHYLDKKYGKYDLTNEKYVSKAVKCVEKLVKGNPFGSIEKVKDSTALAAAGMILDRHQPVVKYSRNENLNVDTDLFDLEKYRNRECPDCGICHSKAVGCKTEVSEPLREASPQ
ncbi:MAG: hypothetical protein ACE5KK_03320 [Candidatus Brocadiales bacterium]